MRRIVLITWVSASGKTNLQKELFRKWWVWPLNFTTRQPRDEEAFKVDSEWDFISKELDEYIFLNRHTFARKLANWDFIESTQYWWNLYWIGKTSVLEWEKNLVLIVDPVGRAQIMEALQRLWYAYETYYLYIDKETQSKRLENRWDNTEEIRKRNKDFEWFHPTNKCIRLNWALSSSELANIIDSNYK